MVAYAEYGMKGKNLIFFDQILFPRECLETVLQHCQDLAVRGHFLVRNTLGKVGQKYYWPGHYTYFEQYVKSCDTCVKRKKSIRMKRAPMQITGAEYSMERIATDMLGPLPETSHGNRYILVIGDYFTKWTETFAIPD